MATNLSVPKAKAFPIRPRSRRLAALMQTCAFILAVNWCLQGMRGMDPKELAFRLAAELLLAAALAWALSRALDWPAAAALGLAAAHTASFTLNGQVWVCARCCRWWRREPAVLEAWLGGLVSELQGLPWLREAACIGSRGGAGLIRGDRADLDLRLVVPPGLHGWLRANLLLLRLRSRAFLARVPLDLYAYDDPDSLRRFDQRERLLVLLDRDGRLVRGFPDRVSPWPGWSGPSRAAPAGPTRRAGTWPSSSARPRACTSSTAST